MSPPEKPNGPSLTEAEVDALYGLEPAIGTEPANTDADANPAVVLVHCPYCGEAFETSADASAGPCKYVEDCQVCCQPIEMELRVEADGTFEELVPRRGDS
jgi:cysteine-rich CPXCG protein